MNGLVLALLGLAFGEGRVAIPEGRFAPLFGLDEKLKQTEFKVPAFWIDERPTSRKEFRKFLVLKPEWSASKVAPEYRDENYLKGLSGPVAHSMTNVSWYAASAYCEFIGGRLPTTLEWEYVAAANQSKPDAQKDPEFNARILKWYSIPSGKEKARKAGSGEKNYYGLRDLHGSIWEWTSDFNSFFITSDNRADGDQNKGLFCGFGSTGAKDRESYAGFMRYAFRSSLEAKFSLPNLGFRCAYDQAK